MRGASATQTNEQTAGITRCTLDEAARPDCRRRGDCVLGLEPGTVTPIGRGSLREAGKLPLPEGQGEQRFRIRFEVADSTQQPDRIEERARDLGR